LVQAIGYQLIKAGFQVLYTSIFDLVRELQAEQSPAELDRTLARYLKPDVLQIDDMGLKVLPPKAGEILLEIILRRYENRSTFMTSNRPIEEWGKLLNDVPAATAILDRFLHHAQIIEMKGRSYRLRQGGRFNEEEKPAENSGLSAGKKK
jgi:DNA replication protein DnaC